MKRKWLAALGVAGTMVFAASIASADLVLTADDVATGGTDVIVADNVGAGVFLAGSGLTTTHADGSAEVGFVVYEGPIGDFLANTVSGSSDPIVGPPAQMNLSSLNLSDVAGVLTLSLTDTDFSSALPFGVDHAIGGTTNGTVVSEWGADLDNGHFSFASGFGSIGPFGPGAFDAESSIGGLGADPSFSLTNSVTVTHAGGGSLTSFSSNVIVPEPGTALLLIVALPLFLRRR